MIIFDSSMDELVRLRPLSLEDKETFYQWATQSDATPFWYGDLYGDKIPSREIFFQDWKDVYFDGSKPQEYRSFAIVIATTGEEIGQINYQRYTEENEQDAYDVDILIANDTHKNKGYGSSALRVLVEYMRKNTPAQKIFLCALAENSRAIRAYKKAGFCQEKTFIDEGKRKWVKLSI